MAETIILNGSNYEFEIFLVNASERSKMQVFPISKSSIKYLEITNDLVNIGYTGKVVLTNYYSILEKFKLLTSSNETPYMYIRFKNLDFQSTTSTYDDIYLTASLQEGQEIKLNAIDGNITYNFEELCISRLKRTRVTFLQNNIGTLYQSTDLSDTLLDTLTPAQHIKNYFLYGVADSDIDGTISTTEVQIEGTPNSVRENVAKITNITNPDSYYTIIEKLYSYLSFETNLNGWYGPGILSLENDEKTGKRKLVISSMFDRLYTFFDLIKNKPNSKDIKHYLLERFNVAQTGDAPYFSDNYLDKYELKRVNYNDVLENKWASIELIEQTPLCADSLYVIKYDQLRAAFENICTKPFASNLPDRKNDVEMDRIKRLQYSRPNIDSTLAQVYGINKVFKSFVFDNLTVTFRTKGQPYRKSGKFITIQTDHKDINKKNTEAEEINGYWYIVSVSHVFEGDNYFNDFICVKVYSTAGSVSPPPSPPSPYTPASTSTRPNGTEGVIEGPGNVKFAEPLPEGKGTLNKGVLPPKGNTPKEDELGTPPLKNGVPNPDFKQEEIYPDFDFNAVPDQGLDPNFFNKGPGNVPTTGKIT